MVFSDGPLLASATDHIGSRQAMHAPITRDVESLAAAATTAVTGVGPLTHGILGPSVVELDPLATRPANALDRRFPSVWTRASQAGLRTIAIDWPITASDPDLPGSLAPGVITAITAKEGDPDAALLASFLPQGADATVQARAARLAARVDMSITRALTALEDPPHLLAVTLRSPPAEFRTAAYAEQMEARVTRLVQTAPDACNIVFVHRLLVPGLSGGRLTGSLIADDPPPTMQRVRLAHIGSLLYRLLGVEAPAGVALLRAAPESDQQSSPLPVEAREDLRDWDAVTAAVLQRVADAPDDPLTMAAHRSLAGSISTAMVDACMSRAWEALAHWSGMLLDVAPSPRAAWMHVLALRRRGRDEALPNAIAALAELAPDAAVTRVAQSISLIDSDADAAADLLRGLDAASLAMPTALGTFGRMSIRAGLEEQGIEAIRTAIQLDAAIPADRITLASLRLKRGEPKRALHALGGIGRRGGNKAWRLLRLRVLLALDRVEDAESLAASIAAQFPGIDDAQAILKAHRQQGG